MMTPLSKYRLATYVTPSGTMTTISLNWNSAKRMNKKMKYSATLSISVMKGCPKREQRTAH